MLEQLILLIYKISPFTREAAIVALWSENAEAVDSEMLLDCGRVGYGLHL